MSTRYADVIDRAEISEIIGDTYQNAAKLVQSGIVALEGNITQGTTQEWIKETLFESDSAGQVVGVNSEISLKAKSQLKYQIPVCERADGAELDDIFEDISPKVKRAAETMVVNGINRKSGQMVDEVLINILNGVGAYQKANTSNYLDKSSSQVSIAILQEAKSKRTDEGLFDGGILLAKGLTIHKLFSLGQLVWTSNSYGVAATDEMIASGKIQTLLGMSMLMDDKVPLDSTAHFIYLLERGALIAKNGGAPMIDPIQRKERAFVDVLKFRVRIGGTVRGMSWGGGSSDVISNTLLATAGSWSLAASYAKYVPMVTLSVQAPSF